MLKDNKKSDFLNQLTFEPKPGPTGINLSGFLEKRELVEIAGAWIGLYKSFERAGFQIVDRTSKNRLMVRYYTVK